ENLTVIANPIESTLARVNMTTYEVTITARNPFPYPINAEITQNTNSWNVSIPPRETKTLNYTIHPELGIETTIPPAYMEYFDFQHNVTVTFASDAINFTATGIEIKGDLPYEISDYVEVNLSITNLVNVTNGTFNLNLIGNESFEYNTTANIENLAVYTVDFGPIAVPAGEYIGILTFNSGDATISIDSRFMLKVEKYPPVANFTFTPQYPAINQNITFNASLSSVDGYITNYTSNFDDGNTTTVSDPIITHAYTEPGTYNVTLTITDNDGLTNTTTRNVTVDDGFCLFLEAGWNLVSVPKPILPVDAVTLFNLSLGESAHYYDAATDSWINDGAIIVHPCQGYWVYKVAPEMICVHYDTTTLVPPVQELYVGWNMIGHITDEGWTVEEFVRVTGLDGKCLMLSTVEYQGMTSTDLRLVYSYPPAPGISEFTDMTPGYGYWAFLTEEHLMPGTTA
ncbi:MAG: PKD domain-containing protein, partial [Candidatus Syntropharchaeales archaeon]